MEHDPTEAIRRVLVSQVNGAVESDDPNAERKRLTLEYGQVWNTQELGETFEVLGFMAPFVVVRRKEDGAKGSLEFQHSPRFYFGFKAD